MQPHTDPALLQYAFWLYSHSTVYIVMSLIFAFAAPSAWRLWKRGRSGV